MKNKVVNLVMTALLLLQPILLVQPVMAKKKVQQKTFKIRKARAENEIKIKNLTKEALDIQVILPLGLKSSIKQIHLKPKEKKLIQIPIDLSKQGFEARVQQETKTGKLVSSQIVFKDLASGFARDYFVGFPPGIPNTSIRLKHESDWVEENIFLIGFLLSPILMPVGLITMPFMEPYLSFEAKAKGFDSVHKLSNMPQGHWLPYARIRYIQDKSLDWYDVELFYEYSTHSANALDYYDTQLQLSLLPTILVDKKGNITELPNNSDLIYLNSKVVNFSMKSAQNESYNLATEKIPYKQSLWNSVKPIMSSGLINRDRLSFRVNVASTLEAMNEHKCKRAVFKMLVYDTVKQKHSTKYFTLSGFKKPAWRKSYNDFWLEQGNQIPQKLRVKTNRQYFSLEK